MTPRPKTCFRAHAPDENTHHPMRGSTLPEQDPRSSETFTAALSGIDHGTVAGKANDLLVELVHAVREKGRKGSVTVVLEVRPYKGNSLNVEVAASVTAKLPQPEPPAGLFFVTEDGALTRDDPRYDRLFDTDSEGRPVQ